MDNEARRDLEMLKALTADGHITQRSLASKLGIALGLANIYVKRLVTKGYIKCVNVKPNRILYLITPKGIAEKTRLTYEFMEYSLHLYREARRNLREVLQPLATDGRSRIAIYGTGEAAELAYLSLREFGLHPEVVFDDGGPGVFLGMPVCDVQDHASVEFDWLIVATLGDVEPVLSRLGDLGIATEKLVPLRPVAQLASARPARGDGTTSA